MSASDFPATRDAVGRLGGWLTQLAAPLGPPVLVDTPPNPHFEFASKDAAVVEIAKAVRMASALSACLYLADAGYVAEVGTLLRGVEDFDQELAFISEPFFGGKETAVRSKFVADFFEPTPRNIAELVASKKKAWVSRSAIDEGRQRIADAANVSGKDLILHGRVLALHQNAYVHGGYLPSMDLWDPHQKKFLTNGHVSPDQHRAAKQNIAVQVFRVLITFWALAVERGQDKLAAEIHSVFQAFEQSAEYQAIVSQQAR